MVPWAIVLALGAAGFVWYRTNSAERGLGAGIAVFATIGIVAAFLVGSMLGVADWGLGFEVPSGVWAFTLMFFVFFAGLFYAGWRMFKRGE